MSLENNMKSGKLYKEFGHKDPEDIKYEKVIEEQRMNCKELVYDYNRLRPKDIENKNRLLKKILGRIGKNSWIEEPCHFSYGVNTYIGDNFYANFNLAVVDDGEVRIGDNVMFGPNITLSTTGHPIYEEYRRGGTQFSIPIVIGNDVWLGANIVILPGVTIGNNVVIGAGSVVTKDIPDNTLAYGNPCQAVREINEYDREYYRKNMSVNMDW